MPAIFFRRQFRCRFAPFARRASTWPITPSARRVRRPLFSCTVFPTTRAAGIRLPRLWPRAASARLRPSCAASGPRAFLTRIVPAAARSRRSPTMCWSSPMRSSWAPSFSSATTGARARLTPPPRWHPTASPGSSRSRWATALTCLASRRPSSRPAPTGTSGISAMRSDAPHSPPIAAPSAGSSGQPGRPRGPSAMRISRPLRNLRQRGFRRCGRPLLPPSLGRRTGRFTLRARSEAARRIPADHRAHHAPARRERPRDTRRIHRRPGASVPRQLRATHPPRRRPLHPRECPDLVLEAILERVHADPR